MITIFMELDAMTKKLSLLLLFMLFTSCLESKTANSPEKSHMRIKTIHGDILIKFEDKKAPITSKRIKELVSNGFYNGLKFHRVIPGFVAQGGDPKGTGTGGSGKKIKAEFSDLKHEVGTVAMARGPDINSADSQFYISLGKHPHLDGKYTVFGQVVEGIENAKKIVQGDKMLQVTLE